MGENFEVRPGEFEEKVIKASSNQPIIVDFWAEWCAPCRMLEPILERIVEEYQGKVSLARVNVDENRELATTYQISAIPSVKVFKQGKVVSEFIGVKPESELKQILSEVIE